MIIGVDGKTIVIVFIIAAIILSMEMFGKILGLTTAMKIVGGVSNKVGNAVNDAIETKEKD